MSIHIPIEIINIILSYREKHPIRNVICCNNCGDEEYFGDCLYIYHRKYFHPHLGMFYFEVVCSDCNYDLSKYS